MVSPHKKNIPYVSVSVMAILQYFLTMHFPMILKLTIRFSVTMSRSSKILTTIKFLVYFCYNIDSLNLVKLSILQTLLTSTRYVVLSVPICVSDLKTQLLIKTFSDRKLFLNDFLSLILQKFDKTSEIL